MQTCSKNLVTICMQEAHLTLFAHKELSQDCSRDWSVRRKVLLIAQGTHGCLKHTQCLALVTQLYKNGSRNGNPVGQAGWERGTKADFAGAAPLSAAGWFLHAASWC